MTLFSVNEKNREVFGVIRFNNDYNRGAMRCVLDAIESAGSDSFAGYGEDERCEQARETIRGAVGVPDADVHFFPGATQANFVVISSMLTPVQSVISADTGHINCHEAASVENTGHKIIELPNVDGKLTAAQIRACAAEYYLGGEPEYLTEPKAVYISFPTESGTLYSLRELREISEVCREFGMYLFVDGARMGYGLGAERNDIALADFAKYSDVFYIGGTKCGALFGEALVIVSNSLKRRFKAHMKQSGAVLAKGFLLGIQFSALLESGEYFTLCRRADEQAMLIKNAFEKKGIKMRSQSYTNQQFAILSDAQKATLARDFIFEESGTCDGGTVVRFCTSWATSDDEVKALVDAVGRL